MLAITDDYMAYCIDNTVFAFGSALRGELDSVKAKTDEEGKRKREKILNSWLGLPQKFRNPGMVGPGSNIDQSYTVKGEAT
jgi:hypothetical protein